MHFRISRIDDWPGKLGEMVTNHGKHQIDKASKADMTNGRLEKRGIRVRKKMK